MASWTCTSCAGHNPAGTVFCGHCGQRPAVAAGDVAWTCRACGSANPSAMRFCGRCGGQRTPDKQDEVRLITALFADVSGFTALADTLDTESLHEVVRPLISGLAEVAERYGGFLEKYAGDALLAVYGAPVTHEDDAQRALATALEMHETLPELRARLGPAAAGLTVHIGVNTGRVIAGRIGSEGSADYGVLGDSVILAQRLESVCPSGQTYVGASTYALTHEDFDFEDVGEVQLKGKQRPVRAYRLHGRRTTSSGREPRLVGRRRELDRVLRTLAGPSVVAVVGDAGTGKSRLLEAARERWRDDGHLWLGARCLSYGASLPYWPFADLLRQQTGSPGDLDPARVLTRWSADLPAEAVEAGRYLLGVGDPGADPRTARRAVHDGVRAWLSTLSARGAVVLAVEDVHWLDAASRDLLDDLVADPADVPMRVVLSARPGQLPPLPPHTVRVDLDGLDPGGVAHLASAALGAPADDALVDMLVERTAGNPLFVEQLLRAMRDAGQLLRTRSGWGLAPGATTVDVPTTVERVFATRLDALPPPAAGVLQLMSVVGRTARMPLLQAVADAERVDLAPLGRLAEAGLVQRGVDGGDDAVTFAHALLHDVVYARLLRKRRRELHGRVAQEARRLYGDRDETIGLLARHLYLGGAGVEAADALLRAGRRAAALYANDEAVTHLEHAVEVLEAEADPRLDATVLELGRLQELRGCYQEALQCYDRVTDGSGAAGRASVLRKLGRPEDALRVADDALPSAPASDVPRLQLERGWSLAVLDREAAAVDALTAGLRSCHDDRLRGQLLLQRGRARSLLGELEAARADATSGADLLAAAGDDSALPQALRIVGDVLLRSGDLDEADRTWRRGMQAAERVGHTEEAAGLLLNLGLLALRRGDLDEAVQLDRRAVAAFERLGHGSGRAVGYANLAECLLARGDLGEAERYAELAVAQARAVGQDSTRADALRTLAAVCLATGERSRARAHADLSAELFLTVGEPDEARVSRELVGLD